MGWFGPRGDCGCCGEVDPPLCGCETGKTIKLTIQISVTADPIQNGAFNPVWTNTQCANGTYEVFLEKSESGDCNFNHYIESDLCIMQRNGYDVEVRLYTNAPASVPTLMGVDVRWQFPGGGSPATGTMFDFATDMAVVEYYSCDAPYVPAGTASYSPGPNVTISVDYEVVDEPA